MEGRTPNDYNNVTVMMIYIYTGHGLYFQKGTSFRSVYIYALVVPEQCQARMHVDRAFFSDAKSLNDLKCFFNQGQ